jgi:hypothetical protein
MKIRQRMATRLGATSDIDARDANTITALAEAYEERILDLVERLRLDERRLRSAVLDRASLVDLWPLVAHDPTGQLSFEGFHWARVAFPEDQQPSTGLPAWPSDISQSDLADLIDQAGDKDAEPLVKALRAGWFFPRVGLIGIADDAYEPSSLKTAGRRLRPALEGALRKFPLNECILLLTIIRAVRADAARRFIPISSRAESRAAVAVMSQGSRGPWLTEQAEITKSKLELVWDGKPQPMQFAFEFNEGFDGAVVRGILDELQEDGLRDYLCLHRMAAEQGRTGTITWTWAEHRERTRYARRIHQNNITDSSAASDVSRRLWRLKRGEIREWRLKPDGRRGWVRIGPFGFIDIPAGLDAPDKSLERARIEINPVLYAGAHRKNTIGKHFALLHEEVLSLDGSTLRLAVLLGFDFRIARDEGGRVRRSTRVLWEHANTRGGRPEQRRWGSADEALQRALDRLQTLGVIGEWHRAPGPPAPDTIYEIQPSAAWRDQVLLEVPPLLPPSTVSLPKTGAELREWRHSRKLSQEALSQLLDVGLATVKRAEMQPSESLGQALRKALATRRTLDAQTVAPTTTLAQPIRELRGRGED